MMVNKDPLAEHIVLMIKKDTKSGASELTHDALNHLAAYAESLELLSALNNKKNLMSLAKRIACSRPSMAPLYNIINEWRVRVDRIEISSNVKFIAEVKILCEQLIADIDTRQHKQCSHAINALKSAQVILTISRSSSVSAVFKKLYQRPLRFIVCESRPGCEGIILAAELASPDTMVDYIVDAASGLYMQKADAVVVGADAILEDGSVVNKCGTSLLAIAAQHFNIPFYVLADSTKCTQTSRANFILEEMPKTELGIVASAFVHPHNVYFDISPAELITAYINEFGVEKNWPWAATSEG